MSFLSASILRYHRPFTATSILSSIYINSSLIYISPAVIPVNRQFHKYSINRILKQHPTIHYRTIITMSPFTIPTTTRAVFQPDIHSTELVLTTLPLEPAKPNTNEHLIKVYATAPCAGELLWAKNFPSIMSPDRVAIPCNDLSGIVVTAPTDSPFQPGTEIYTRTPAARTGNARDFTIALTEELALKPKNLSWVEAASIPLSALTAYQALFTQGGLALGWKDEASRISNSEKRVLVDAGAGGVGVWIVQLAKAAGVKDIMAIVGPDNIDFVKSLGATEVINYRSQSLGAFIKAGGEKVDLAIDMLGGQALADCWTAVRKGGILVSIRESPSGQKPKEGVAKDIRDSFFIMEPYGWQLKDVADLLERGDARPIVDSVFKLEQFKEAFVRLDTGHARGKVMITVAE
jgi:NADPH:quinone reductase-like Zn-dependent oxidoreductase